MTYEYPHLQQLAYLREVERTGSITEAARNLELSQPALSQSLTELERRLGVPLFERSGRRRVLTGAGREAARVAAEVVARVDVLREELGAHARGEAGTLRVGMIDAASLYLLPQAVSAFRAARPAVELQLLVDTSDALLERLAALDLDVAFVVGPIEDGDASARFATVEVAREPLYLYAPAGVAIERAGREAVSGAHWALYPEGSHTRRLIDAALAREGVRTRVSLESANPEVLRQVVALGLGWGVLPAAVAERAPDPLRRARREPLVTRSLVAARRVAAPPDARVETLLALAR